MKTKSDRWEGLGMLPGMLEPGMAVMVAAGTINAVVNGDPPIICYATVIDRAEAPDTWWLNVHMGMGSTLPQMYRADQILGIPALGLFVEGA
jgi:hypothetical protein